MSSQVKSAPNNLTGPKKNTARAKILSFNSNDTDFGIMVHGFYLGFDLPNAVFDFQMSSQVKSDPADLTGLKKQSWSQNMGSLAQKTKIC